MAKAGRFKLTLSKPFFNGVVNILEEFAEDENKFTDFANYMREKFLKYGRFFISKNDDECFIIHLYDNEVELLMKMMSIFTYATSSCDRDFYSEYQKHSLKNNE